MEKLVEILETEAVCTGIYLIYGFICAVSDLKKRHISLSLSLGAAVVAVVMAVIKGEGLKSLALSVTVGAAMLAISRISGCLGAGDAVYMVICGLFTGCGHAALVCISAWFMCGAAGLVMILKGRGRNMTLPFVSVAFIAEIIIRLMGQLNLII